MEDAVITVFLFLKEGSVPALMEVTGNAPLLVSDADTLGIKKMIIQLFNLNSFRESCAGIEEPTYLKQTTNCLLLHSLIIFNIWPSMECCYT